MGFFSKFFRSSEEPKKLSLEEALALSKKKLNDIDLKPAEKLCAEARDSVKRFKNTLARLSDAGITEEMDPRLHAIVCESKKQLVKHMSSALDGLDFQTESYDEIIQMRDSLRSAMRKISTGNPKHAHFVALEFREPMQEVGKSAAELTNITNELDHYILKLKEENEPCERLLSIFSEKNKLVAEVAELEKNIKKLHAERTALEKTKIEEVDVPSIALAEEKFRDAEAQIFALLAPLGRVLRKYEKIAPLDKKEREALRAYIEKPVNATFEFDIEKILAGVEKNQRDLRLKDKAWKKASAIIKRIKSGELQELIERYKQCASELEKERKKIKPLLEKKREAELALAEKNEKLASAAKYLAEIGEALNNKKQNLIKVEQSLESAVSKVR